MYLTPRPGQIKYFIIHKLYFNNIAYEHVFAVVDWFLPLPDVLRYKYGKPVEIWCSEVHEPFGPASFLTVQRIKCKFIAIKHEENFRKVMAVLPRNRSLNV